MEPKQGHLLVKLLAARNLSPTDLNGRADPYAVTGILNLNRDNLDSAFPIFKSHVVKKNLNPVWVKEPIYEFPFTEEEQWLQVELFDRDLIGKHDFLGQVTLKPGLLPDGILVDEWYPLQGRPKRKDEVSGHIQKNKKSHEYYEIKEKKSMDMSKTVLSK
eukprot:Phypoly_transcript_16921.p1 GENE.Phypoly_transcript_16921~~Phypoly_transcript_16921.p1  ORF type:complete len:160 (+),score=21.28 Phypoly_transcript_16921:69-548(+)